MKESNVLGVVHLLYDGVTYNVNVALESRAGKYAAKGGSIP